MGIRFQVDPNGAFHDIILHVRMLDGENRLQQEAIGMLGVNLVYGAFDLTVENPDDFIASLTDNIGLDRIEVDMIEFNGPDFEKFDNPDSLPKIGRVWAFRCDYVRPQWLCRASSGRTLQKGMLGGKR